MPFAVDERVEKIGNCHYDHAGDKSGVEKGEKGTVREVIHRYQNTSAAYTLYVVEFDGHMPFNEYELNNRYTESCLKAHA